MGGSKSKDAKPKAKSTHDHGGGNGRGDVVVALIQYDTQPFWALEREIDEWMNNQMACYNEERIKKGEREIRFKAESAWTITNTKLEQQFTAGRRRLAAKGRKGKYVQLQVERAFYGTHPEFIDIITNNGCKLNNKYIAISRRIDFALKHSNRGAPLQPDDQVKVLMCDVVPGAWKHLTDTKLPTDPTPDCDSYLSKTGREWYLFNEDQCMPRYIVTMRAYELADDDGDQMPRTASVAYALSSINYTESKVSAASSSSSRITTKSISKNSGASSSSSSRRSGGSDRDRYDSNAPWLSSSLVIGMLHVSTPHGEDAISLLYTHLTSSSSSAGSSGVGAADMVKLELPSSPSPSSEPKLYRPQSCGTRIDDQLFITGGVNRRGEAMRNVDIYHLLSQTWSTGTNMPNGRAGHIMVPLSGTTNDQRIMIIGGSSDEKSITACASCEMYDTRGNAWCMVPELHCARRDTCGVGYQGGIYVFGGVCNARPRKSCEVYREDGKGEGEWSKLANMNTKRYHAAAVVIENKILVLGGLTSRVVGRDEPVDTIEELTPASGKWRTLPVRLPHAMSSFRAVYHDATKTLMITGGGTDMYTIAMVDLFVSSSTAADKWRCYSGIFNTVGTPHISCA